MSIESGSRHQSMPRGRSGIDIRSGKLPWILYLIPYLYGTTVFIAMHQNTFWLDDYGFVSSALHATHEPAHLLDPQAGFFRPMVNLIFTLNFLASGLNPFGYYLVNLLLHLFNAWLIWQLAFRLSGGKVAVAALASTLFAGAVGNYGEAVIWISGRTELVATAFYVGTLLCFWSFLQQQRYLTYVLSLLGFVFAHLSKESAISLLPVLITLDFIGTRRPIRALFTPSHLKWYVPFGLLLIPYLFYQAGLQQGNYVVKEGHYQPGWHMLINLVEYLRLMILPVTPESTVVTVPEVVRTYLSFLQLCVGLPLLCGWASIFLLRVHPPIKFAAAMVIISILPYAGFTWKTTTRYLYLPSVGFVIVVSFLAMSVLRRFSCPTPMTAMLVGLPLAVLLSVQWAVVNYLIRQWHMLQLQQDPAAYQALLHLAKILGY